VAYYKYLKLIDNILFQDEQLKAVGQVPTYLTELNKTDLQTWHPKDLYDYLKKLETYRQITTQVAQIEGDLFYKVRDKIGQIEGLFHPQVFIATEANKQERMDKLTALQEQYPLCRLCHEETSEEIALIQQSIDDEQRTALFALQNQQLKYRKCFSDVQLKALQQLQLRYPNQDSLSTMESALFSAYLDKINGLETVADQYNQLAAVSIEKIPSDQLATTFTYYENLLLSFSNEACHLYHGELLGKEDLECIGQPCKVAVP